MKLLQTFAALSLASGAVMALLPEGGLRRTAGMVVGLLMLLCWAEGIGELLALPLEFALPETVLSASGTDVTEAAAFALNTLQKEGTP